MLMLTGTLYCLASASDCNGATTYTMGTKKDNNLPYWSVLHWRFVDQQSLSSIGNDGEAVAVLNVLMMSACTTMTTFQASKAVTVYEIWMHRMQNAHACAWLLAMQNFGIHAL